MNNCIDYECNENGYIEYLSKWSVDEKSSSRDHSSNEFEKRLNNFKENCLKIHEWNRKDKYKLEFTYYADWRLEEFVMHAYTT